MCALPLIQGSCYRLSEERFKVEYSVFYKNVWSVSIIQELWAPLVIKTCSHPPPTNARRHMQAHWDALLLNVAFPRMCFNDEDFQLWTDDPQEYIRKVQLLSFLVLRICLRQLATARVREIFLVRVKDLHACVMSEAQYKLGC